jgi:antitoxin component YwqK of YwqJK toxin-antitoxin module
MKGIVLKIALMCLVLPLCVFAQPKNEVNPNGFNTFYYDNGKISSEGTMREGKPDGYWKNFYQNGNIKNEGNRLNYELDSAWKFYDEKGRITRSLMYKNGKKNGYTITYDSLGRITVKENFVDNVKTGNSYSYYKSGKTKQLVPYKNGKAEGTAYEYSEDSVITAITVYKMGFIERSEKINKKDANGQKQGLWKEFYPDGTVKSETRYKNNEVDGYRKEFDQKGNLQNIEKFDNGKKVANPPELAKLDVFKAYYENGQVRYEGGYVNGMPVGTHYHYKLTKEVCDSILVYDDTVSKKILHCEKISIPDSAIVYDEGYLVEKGAVDSIRRKQGTWTEYHLTGEFRAKGLYKDNNKNGEWIYYYPDGKVEQKGKYNKQGHPTGEWTWYYENGQIWRQEHYKGGKLEGLMQEYKEDGKLITKGEYQDDLKEGPWYYEIENYKEQGNYRAGEPDSIWKAWWVKENRLLFVGNFISGDPDGKHIMYYPNGKIMSVGSYTGGMKQGTWKYYDEQGMPLTTVDYDSDIETKWNNQPIVPTYEDALRAYEGARKKSDPGKGNKDGKTTKPVNESEQ